MMNKRSIVVSALLVLGACNSLQSMSFDNRFIPWNPKPIFRTPERRSFFKTESFFILGDSAYGDPSRKDKGIPELYGRLDLQKLGTAVVAAGQVNPLQPFWQAFNTILWDVEGKIQGQGFNVTGEFAVSRFVSFGGSASFLHVTSNQQFIIPKDTVREMVLSAADEGLLDANRRAMLKSVGLIEGQWSSSSLSDITLYGRCGFYEEYKLKTRKIDMGFTLGTVIPVAKERDINNMASIPVGGDDHWGIIAGFDTSVELKEDWWINFFVKINKRFSKIQNKRLSISGEPVIFGATTGNVDVDPGFMCVFSPTLKFDDIQNGFGAHLQYFYGFHRGDVWTDVRADKTIAVDLTAINSLTKWKTEYVLFNAFYDFGRMHIDTKLAPVVSFSWEIPVKLLKPKDVSKTQRISLGVSFHF